MKIMLTAGEASGDRLGAGLARALKRRRPDVELLGMGGDDMAEAGVRLVQHASEVAVVGFTEVLAHLPQIRAAMARLEECLARERPDLLVPIDYPDFNLRLAARARRRDVQVVYFVSPQVWAWRRGRVRRIRELVRRMLVLFPFETAFYEDAGVPVTFVGHPLIESVPERVDRRELLAGAGLSADRPVVALLPGSRRGELARLVPPMLAAARRLRERRPELQFLVPRARTVTEEQLRSALDGAAPEGTRIHDRDYPAVLAACDAGVVASGTATLDAALAGLPIVVVYRMRGLSYLIGRLLVSVEHFALPNLVAQRRVVPELYQGACRAETIAEHVERYLDDPGEAQRVREGLAEVRARLGPPGAFDRAAEAVLAEIGAGAGVF